VQVAPAPLSKRRSSFLFCCVLNRCGWKKGGDDADVSDVHCRHFPFHSSLLFVLCVLFFFLAAHHVAVLHPPQEGDQKKKKTRKEEYAAIKRESKNHMYAHRQLNPPPLFLP
jgi:hypothetical protein